MDTCAKCGKRDWKNLRYDPYRYAEEAGVFPEYAGKHVCGSCQCELLDSKQIPHLGFSARSEARKRIRELTTNSESIVIVTSPFKRLKDSEYTSCINGLGLLEGETIKLQYYCHRQVISNPSMWDGKQRMESHKGLLVFSDDNMIFMQQEGNFSSDYAQALRISIGSIAGLVTGGSLIKHIRFTIGVAGASQQYEFSLFQGIQMGNDIIGVREEIEKHLKQARVSKKAQNEKANVKIILDFSSLKDAMSKGGLVMSTYKCPNCNGMVDIPEAGKVLLCKYCGTPIKPVDIFEQIKSLIQ